MPISDNFIPFLTQTLTLPRAYVESQIDGGTTLSALKATHLGSPRGTPRGQAYMVLKDWFDEQTQCYVYTLTHYYDPKYGLHLSH